MTEIKLYNPSDALALCGDKSKEPDAKFNQAAGPAYSIFVDDKLICCGGVRVYGIGEAWFLTTDEYGRKYAKTILRASQQQIDAMIREERLWGLWARADTNGSGNFFKHLGFRKIEAFVR